MQCVWAAFNTPQSIPRRKQWGHRPSWDDDCNMAGCSTQTQQAAGEVAALEKANEGVVPSSRSLRLGFPATQAFAADICILIA
jgi:hypothetical protein